MKLFHLAELGGGQPPLGRGDLEIRRHIARQNHQRSALLLDRKGMYHRLPARQPELRVQIGAPLALPGQRDAIGCRLRAQPGGRFIATKITRRGMGAGAHGQ